MTEEQWRPIPGYEGFYEVSDLGRIRSVDRVTIFSDGRKRPLRGCLMKTQLNQRTGRNQITLSRNNRLRTHRVYILVMKAFVGPCPAGMEVCHNDGQRTNDVLTNLRYDTASNNHLDKRAHGTDHNRNKTHCPQGHPYSGGNIYVPPSKPRSRECLTCIRERGRQRRSA